MKRTFYILVCLISLLLSSCGPEAGMSPENDLVNRTWIDYYNENGYEYEHTLIFYPNQTGYETRIEYHPGGGYTTDQYSFRWHWGSYPSFLILDYGEYILHFDIYYFDSGLLEGYFDNRYSYFTLF